MQHIDHTLTEQHLDDLDEILDNTFIDLEAQEKKRSDTPDLDALLDEVTLEYSKEHNPSQKGIELDDMDDCTVLPKDSNMQSNTQGSVQSDINHIFAALYKNPGIAAMYKDKNFLAMVANNAADILIPMMSNNPQFIEQMNASHARDCKKPGCKHDATAFLTDPNFKNNFISHIENMTDENIDEWMTNTNEQIDDLTPIIMNPENLNAFYNHPNTGNLATTILKNPNVTDAIVQVLSDPELHKSLNTQNSEQDKLKETITTICHNNPELLNMANGVHSSVHLNLAINALFAATNINEQEDSEYTKLLKAAGNKVGLTAQEARNLSIEDKQKLFLYVTETTKLIKNPQSDLTNYSTYITEAIGMNSSTGKHIALSMLVVAGVILLLATIALSVALAAATYGASIPFTALAITALGGTVTASVTAAAAGVTGLSFAVFGGVFAERARKGDIHLAMDDFSSACRIN